MTQLHYKTKGDALPNGKPRVYFTCHPEDLARYFEKIAEDIFRTHDCAIFYTPDMSTPIAAEELDATLGRMSLFLIPVSSLLLSSPCRAMAQDLAYAKANHIPILPFMMESGLDEIYCAPEKFGQRQYLEPGTRDLTQLRYEDKLKKHLDSVLFSDDMIQRIRAAFDAYIFLSYRKKDRVHANELMKLIHKNPACRDLAIWFDEFLTPGESFMDGIQKALSDCKLFALLVTPHLLEEVDGKPNFVMAQEYPAAKKAGKDIFPVEMLPTDPQDLAEKFLDLPQCVEPQTPLFDQRLLQALERLAITSGKEDPEHTFLIGLAYLEGIDVEVDHHKAFQLIAQAANAGLPEAMKRLRDMYLEGHFLPQSISTAAQWGQKLIAHAERTCGRDHPDTVAALMAQGDLYRQQQNQETAAARFYEEALEIHERLCPQPNTCTISLWKNLAQTYRICDPGREIEARKNVYHFTHMVYGDAHEAFYLSICHLASAYAEQRMSDANIPLVEPWIHRAEKSLGDQHPTTLALIHALAYAYSKADRLPEALSLYTRICENHPRETAADKRSLAPSLFNLARCHQDLGHKVQAADLYAQAYWLMAEADPDPYIYEKALETFCETQGLFDHLLTFREQRLAALLKKEGADSSAAVHLQLKIADTQVQRKAFPEAMAILQSLYDQMLSDGFIAWFSSGPSSTVTIMEKQAAVCKCSGDTRKATFYEEKCVLTENLLPAPNTDPFRSPFSKLRDFYKACGDRQKALEQAESLYNQLQQDRVIFHKDTLSLLQDLATGYSTLGNYEKALPYINRAVELQSAYLEKDHPNLIAGLRLLVTACRQTGDSARAQQLEAQLRQLEKGLPSPLPDSPARLRHLLTLKNRYTQAQLLPVREALYRLLCREQGALSREALIELNNLANAHLELGNFTQAAAMYQQAYDTAVLIIGKNAMLEFFGFHTEDILSRLTQCYKQLGNKEKWVVTARLCYELLCKHKTAHYPQTHTALCHLAEACRETGDAAGAAALLEAEYARLIAENPSLSAKKTIIDPLLQDLIKTHLALKDRRKAAQLYGELVVLRQEVYGKEHIKTATAMGQLAVMHNLLKEYEAALRLQKEVYPLFVRLTGETSLKSLTQLNNLVTCYEMANQFAEALPLAERSYQLHSQIFGESDSKTLTILWYLAHDLAQVGDLTKARAIGQQLYAQYQQTLGKDSIEATNTASFLASLDQLQSDKG